VASRGASPVPRSLCGCEEGVSESEGSMWPPGGLSKSEGFVWPQGKLVRFRGIRMAARDACSVLRSVWLPGGCVTLRGVRVAARGRVRVRGGRVVVRGVRIQGGVSGSGAVFWPQGSIFDSEGSV